MTGHSKAQFVKEQAAELGFLACGISGATRLDEEEAQLEAWLNKGFHGSMKWMENHFEKRLNPSELVPGAKVVISLLFNYYPPVRADEGAAGISTYAFGTDYHRVVKQRMHQLADILLNEFGPFQYKAFVDSAPVLERALAAKAGLGWIGKHSLLLRKGEGSFFFIGQLIADLELPPDGPVTDHCGTCTACVDACPTNAIVADRVVDSTKCISYLTIELRDEIPAEFEGKFGNWIYGCDICQDVCPWNRFATPHREPEFALRPEIRRFSLSDWLNVDEAGFKRIFSKSAVKRTKYSGFQRNVLFATRNFTNREHKTN